MIRLLIQVAFEKSIYNAAPSAKILDLKKEEKLKLMSLDSYNSLPFLFLDRGFSIAGIEGGRRGRKPSSILLGTHHVPRPVLGTELTRYLI